MSGVDPQRLRPEIEESWSRALRCGLNTSTVRHTEVLDVDLGSRFARAAVAVIDQLCDQLAGERVAFMLTNKSARLIKTAQADTALTSAMDSIGAVVGTVWSEENTGTNALATPFETRRPIFVHGSEHYVEPMKDFSCYGAPIFDPVTGRLEGVLDIMTDRTSENALMIPVVDSAITQIQQTLRAGQTRSSAALLSRFETVFGASAHPVVAIGPSVVFQSAKASQMLTADDIEQLRTTVLGRARNHTTNTVITLQNGLNAALTIEDVSSTIGAVVTIRVEDRALIPRNALSRDVFRDIDQAVTRIRGESGSLVIVGEPGTGRTTVAHAVTAGQSVHEVHALRLSRDEAEEKILTHVRSASEGALVVENIEFLNAKSLSLLANAAVRSDIRVIATCDSTVMAEATPVLARFVHRITLRPLRELRHDLNRVIRVIRPGGPRLQFDTAATKALTSYTWPGNLIELGSLLDSLSDLANRRVVCLSDLPVGLRRGSDRNFTPWQTAARDAIIRALELKHHNKSHAAEFLGISRNSLYHHMREYGLL
ncbi:sigma-54-dependent Fis family transcriptional regulator [Rhodococcus sp. NPDC056960]|uniref:sigma-54-dependent Fis family transcriptional regulator n=1 Tax=Rhodococcus sp. NPDC056960 TaxID=3345982 RepID=UPI00362A57C2